MFFALRILALSLILISAAPAIFAEVTETIDMITIREWSSVFRGWHYYPDYVIKPAPGIEGYEKISMTDVPTVFRVK